MKYIIYIAIISGVVTGFSLPELEGLRVTIPFMIALLLLLNFLELEPDWRRFFRWELLVTVPLSAVVVPLLIYHGFSQGLADAYRAGLFLTAIAPTGIMTLVLGRFIHARDYDLIISNFFATQFGVILYLPFMVQWVLGASASIDAPRLLLQTAAMVIPPYFIALILKKAAGDTAIKKLRKAGKYLIPALVYPIIAISIGAAAGEFTWDRSLAGMAGIVFSIYFIQGGLAWLAGFAFGNRGVRNTLALIASSRNIQLMIGIAVINFPPLTVIPMIIGVLFHHFTNMIWLWLFRK